MGAKKDRLEEEKITIAQGMPRSSCIIRGSLVELKRVCGKPNCRCAKGKKHVSLYVSRSKRGRTEMTYIPREQEKYVRECVEKYKKIANSIKLLTEINLKIAKDKTRR